VGGGGGGDAVSRRDQQYHPSNMSDRGRQQRQFPVNLNSRVTKSFFANAVCFNYCLVYCICVTKI